MLALGGCNDWQLIMYMFSDNAVRYNRIKWLIPMWVLIMPCMQFGHHFFNWNKGISKINFIYYLLEKLFVKECLRNTRCCIKEMNNQC